MRRTLVIGDIHGGLKALKQVFERANVTLTDTLIFLGDYVDGWNDSPNLIDYLIELNKSHTCIFLKGNHDELLENWLLGNTKEIDETMWMKHGGFSTIKAYQNIDKSTIDKHIEFLSSLKDYHIDNDNKLYIHAGFTNMHGVQYEYFPKLFRWDRTLWETALALDSSLPETHEYYPKRFLLYKEIYIGHTPVSRINKTIPIKKANVWNVDTAAAYKGPLSIIDSTTHQFWQSEPVYTLYPTENGRN